MFKIGDIVICIKAPTINTYVGHLGEILEVEEVDVDQGNGLKFKRHHANGNASNRFRLATQEEIHRYNFPKKLEKLINEDI